MDATQVREPCRTVDDSRRVQWGDLRCRPRVCNLRAGLGRPWHWDHDGTIKVGGLSAVLVFSRWIDPGLDFFAVCAGRFEQGLTQVGVPLDESGDAA